MAIAWPEPTPDGFLVPPGMTSALSDYFARMMPDVDAWLAEQLASYIEVSDELLMDCGVIPDTRPKLPPPSWRRRWHHRIEMWRNLTARRAYKIIAGYWPDDGEDDW